MLIYEVIRQGRQNPSEEGGGKMEKMPTIAEIAEKNVRENEQLKLLLLLKEAKSLEDAIKALEAKLQK